MAADELSIVSPELNPRVAVLLSTYNGEVWLGAQLDSLAAQEGVAIEVFVRDDGSTDGTLAVLAKYAQLWPALAAPVRGENLGPAASFVELLRGAPDDFDYYAFCDQDDVWLPDKLARATVRLRKQPEGGPVLYCSSVLCVDSELRPLGARGVDGDARFDHLLFENIAMGNTVVMNPPARMLICSRPPGSGMFMHDWWCALVVSALGTVLYDERPGVLYRQHQGNVIGATPSRLLETFDLLKRLWRDPRNFYPIHAQAAEFLRLYGDAIEPRQRRLTQALVASRRSLIARIRYAVSGEMIRTGLVWTIAGRLLVVADLY